MSKVSSYVEILVNVYINYVVLMCEVKIVCAFIHNTSLALHIGRHVSLGCLMGSQPSTGGFCGRRVDKFL